MNGVCVCFRCRLLVRFNSVFFFPFVVHFSTMKSCADVGNYGTTLFLFILQCSKKQKATITTTTNRIKYGMLFNKQVPDISNQAGCKIAQGVADSVKLLMLQHQFICEMNQRHKYIYSSKTSNIEIEF